ncbi:MAG: type VI secretion system protein ImpB [Paraglaciecola sp.]|jgi:type VI secretion system protein ImpB
MSIQDDLPKSRLTLRYRTEINGEPEDIELPLRLLVLGDFSGTHTPKAAFDERKILNFNGKNLNSIMEKMAIKLQVIDSAEERHTISIENVNSFLPGHIIKSIPAMDEMVKAKKLLNALLSSINNSSKFRNALTSILDNPDSLTLLQNKMEPGYKRTATLPASPTQAQDA